MMTAMRWEEEAHVEDGVTLLRNVGGGRQLSIDGMAELGMRVKELAEDPPVIVLVLDILHADLDAVLELAKGGAPDMFGPVPRAIRGLERYPLPVIAAIPRQASAGGCEVALACDLRAIAPAARIGLYETTMGLIPGAGGTQRLPRLIGYGRAAHLIYRGNTISGKEAHAIGLAEILAEDPVAAALQYAREIASNGRSALAAAKRSLRNAVELPLMEGLRAEGEAFVSLSREPLALERLPNWTPPPADRSV
jgi:enoyl-CoA hydratase